MYLSHGMWNETSLVMLITLCEPLSQTCDSPSSWSNETIAPLRSQMKIIRVEDDRETSRKRKWLWAGRTAPASRATRPWSQAPGHVTSSQDDGHSLSMRSSSFISRRQSHRRSQTDRSPAAPTLYTQMFTYESSPVALLIANNKTTCNLKWYR